MGVYSMTINNKKINIGIIGLGVVGKGVLDILKNNNSFITKGIEREIVIKKAAARSIETLEKSGLPKDVLTQDPMEVVNDKDIDIVIELMGGYEPARTFIETALKNNKSVITANKEVIAISGYELLKLSNEKKVYLKFEASAVAGVPIVSSLYRSLTSYEIKKLIGIINGTTNYILTQMYEKNESFDVALKEAQEMGYAESDPKKDIEGYDATYKIIILSSLAFNAKVNMEDVYREGITLIKRIDIRYADDLNYKIKLIALGSKEENGLDIRVHPMLVPKNHPLSNVDGVYNAVFTEGEGYGKLLFSGPGAGALPAASMVVSDLVDVVRLKGVSYVDDLSIKHFGRASFINIENSTNSYYLRLRVKDRPGVLALIANSFAVHNVSFASVIQKESFGDEVDVVFLTHVIEEFRIKNAISAINNYPEIKEVASLIRVLRN